MGNGERDNALQDAGLDIVARLREYGVPTLDQLAYPGGVKDFEDRVARNKDFSEEPPELELPGREISRDEFRKRLSLHPLAGRKVYLAGPMSGIDNNNYEAFEEAARTLREKWEFNVLNPWALDAVEGEPSGHDEAMARDLPHVCESAALVVLPGWEASKGARIEVATATILGKRIFSYPSLDELDLYVSIDDVPPPAPPDRHPNSARFHDLLEEMGELHDRKQADYGRGDDPFANVRASTEWGVEGWIGAMIRLNDKVRRLQSLALKGYLANEAAIDSFMDIAVYAVIARVLYEQWLETELF